MLASKENARQARRALDAIYRLEPKIEYGIKIELDIIGEFIDAATKRLPRAASYKRDRERRRGKATT
jgi:hypothetical protein